MSSYNINGYRWGSTSLSGAHDYLLGPVFSEMEILNLEDSEKRVFELGCGNGSVGHQFWLKGWSVTGVDPSSEGIGKANISYPHLNLNEGSAYDDLASKYGIFPVVTSLEVVEHVYSPRLYAHTLFSLLKPGGTAIISTPYHGYWKNIALAITGKMDSHFTALWDDGHIKFWSIKTLNILLKEAGFIDIRIHLVGRVPFLAKSMILIAKR